MVIIKIEDLRELYIDPIENLLNYTRFEQVDCADLSARAIIRSLSIIQFANCIYI